MPAPAGPTVRSCSGRRQLVSSQWLRQVGADGLSLPLFLHTHTGTDRLPVCGGNTVCCRVLNVTCADCHVCALSSADRDPLCPGYPSHVSLS
jgi:hypothetical protein